MWSAAASEVAATAEPVSLWEVKEFCRLEIGDSTFDTELAALIAGQRDDVERITGTRLVTQTVKLTAISFADLARLPIGPVQSLVALTWRDRAGTANVIDIADVELFGGGLEAGLRPAPGKAWPAGALDVTVTLVVGYGNEPAEIPGALQILLLRAIRAHFDGQPIELEPQLTNHRIWL